MLRDGRRATALEIQWGLLERAQVRAAPRLGVRRRPSARRARRWEQVLTGLEHDPGRWRARLGGEARLVDGYADRHSIEPGAPPEGDRPTVPRPATRQGVRPTRGLGALVDPADVDEAVTTPPTTTRAYFRAVPRQVPGRDRRRELGLDRVRRGPRTAAACPMMEPLRGTADHVARLIDESDSAVELLERLGS